MRDETVSVTPQKGRGWRVLKWLVRVYLVGAVAYALMVYYDIGHPELSLLLGLLWPILIPMFVWIYLNS